MNVGDVIRPTVVAAGYKGALFVEGLLGAGIRPKRIVSYPQQGDESDSFNALLALGRSHDVAVEDNRHPLLDQDPLIFVVGWQFMLSAGLDRSIVFHDSLLPKFRGFSPTVTALLMGADAAGVTAFRPDSGRDCGAILGSRTVRIVPGSTLRAAFELQAQAMVDLAIEIIKRTANGTLVATAQQGGEATYSLWRDQFDYFIDWRRSSEEVLRHINAHGFPYAGAKAVLDGQVLTIVRASPGPNMAFAVQNPGKLWEVDGSRALVVCGTGTLWIEDARDPNGQAFLFKHLRARFLTADTAWILPFLA